MQEMTLKHTIKTRRFLNENHDSCTICGNVFKESETTHLGYLENGELAYLGDCCSSKLKETIIRHSFSKRPYTIPDKDTIIWRFMDFTKFISLISSNSLFFTRADKFEDPFEGAKGLKKNKNKWDKHYLEFIEQAHKNPPEGIDFKLTDKQIKIESKRVLAEMESGGIEDIKKTFINCWHENEFESEAMWKLYTNNMSEGIAIQTTYDRLYRSLNKNPSIDIGRVNYIDFNTSFAGVNDSFWYKRKSFEHEKEVRAIYFDFKEEYDFGKPIKVNINTLIQKIYVSPTAQNWFLEVVKETIGKYNLKKKIYQSNMKAEPFH
tara:strand:- start:46 stop:1005 length:960 start_codon:yes stop_codon:yes gene_type:complete